MAMSQQINENENARDAWYVMWHLKPQHIETMLQKDSAGLLRKPDDPPLPPYRFYVQGYCGFRLERQGFRATQLLS